MEIEGNILSGQQLIALRLKGNNSRDFPAIGQKEFQPSNSWLEKKQIQSTLGDRKGLIEEERVEKWSSLSSAEWMPDMKKAKVTKKIGKVWENFGHHLNDSDWLFPEEALLLLETNALELLCNTVPLSIERGYMMLINNETGCTLNEYRTFSHLIRLGYKLFRHSAQVSVTRYEKEIRLDQHVLTQKKRPTSGITNINTSNTDTDPKNYVAEEIVQGGSIPLVNSFDNHCHNNDVIVDKDAIYCETNSQLNIKEPVASSDVSSIVSKDTNKNVTLQNKSPVEICIEEDDDEEIIEIPVDKEVVLITDLTSSESEEETACVVDDDETESNEDDTDSDSTISKTSNSNWKRTSDSHASGRNICSVIDVDESPPPPKYAIRTNYVTVNEFLFDSPHKICDKENDVIILSDDDTHETNVQNRNSDSNLGHELQRFYKEIEIIDVESDTDDSSRISIVNTSRKEILDSFPAYKNGEIRVRTPSSLFLPSNIRPVRKEYIMKFIPSDSSINSYNDWTNHKIRTNVKNLFRTPNYQPSRPYGKSYQTNRIRPVVPFYKQQQQWNMMGNNAFQNQIRAMATGVMQVATTLLSLPYSMTGIPSLMGNNGGQQFYQPFNNPYQSQAAVASNANIRPVVNQYFNNGMMQQSHNTNFSDFNRPSFSNHNESFGTMTYPAANNQLPFVNENHPIQTTDRSNRFYNRFDCGSSNSNRVVQNERLCPNQRNANRSPPIIVTNNDMNSRPLQQQTNDVFFNDTQHQRSYHDNNIRQQGEHLFAQHPEVSNLDKDRCFDNRDFSNSDINNSSNVRDYKSSRFYDSNSMRPNRPYRSRPRRWRFFDRQRARRPVNNPTRDTDIVIDTDGDPSVFGDDIPVQDSDMQNESENYIPLSNSNSTKNGTLNNAIDIGNNDMDDINSYTHNKLGGRSRSIGNSKIRHRRQGGRFQDSNRNLPFKSQFNRCESYTSYSDKPFQSRANKKQRMNDNESSLKLNEENDVEVISVRNCTLPSIMKRSMMSNDKNKFRASKRKRYFARTDSNKKRKLNRQNRRNELTKQVSNLNRTDSSIEIIDNEPAEQVLPSEEIFSLKKEKNSDSSQILNIKVEQNKRNEIADLVISQTERPESNIESCQDNLTSGTTVIRCASTISSCSSQQQAHIKIEPDAKIPKNTDVKTESSITAQNNEPNVTALESPGSIISLCKSECHVKREKDVSSQVSETMTIKTEQAVIERVKQESVETQVDDILMNIKTENVSASGVSEKVREPTSDPDRRNLESEQLSTSLNVDTSKEQAVDNSSCLNKGTDLSWALLKQQSSMALITEERSMASAIEEDKVPIQPIITAKDCKSIGTVLSALQIIGRAESSCLQSDSTRKLKISYDVYIPRNVPVKKSARGLPDYRLVIVDFRDPLPVPSEMAELTYRFEDGVPILTAAVLPDSLSFFLTATVDLPTPLNLNS